jgi:hypothetical protein
MGVLDGVLATIPRLPARGRAVCTGAERCHDRHGLPPTQAHEGLGGGPTGRIRWGLARITFYRILRYCERIINTCKHWIIEMNQKLQFICCRLPRGAGVLPTLAAAFFQTLAAALPSQRAPSRRPAAEPHSSSPGLPPSTPMTCDQCEGGTLALPVTFQAY